MRFEVLYTHEAAAQLEALRNDRGRERVWKAVRKTLGLLEADMRHPGLRTHKYRVLAGPGGEEVFEAYAQNQTPGAYRVFWFYGPSRGRLTILAITPHP